MKNCQGLTQSYAQAKLKEEGANELKAEKKTHLAALFFSQFKDVMILILAVAAVISIFMGEGAEAITILAIVLVNAFLGFFQELRTEKTLEALEQLSAPLAVVIRDGRKQSVPARELVKGDLVLLAVGNRVPADCRLLESVHLSCDESMLTGESIPVNKQAEDPLYMGCGIAQGYGKAIITATGMNTEMGKIAGLMEEAEDPPTPLQMRLKQLGKVIAVGCLIICLGVAALGWLQGGDPLQMLLTGVSLAVAAIPEGLPAIVTIVLALSTGRILKRGAVIRKLHAVETLGCASVICSDKTGTITENRMKVCAIWLYNKVYPTKEIKKGAASGLQKDFWKAATLCKGMSENQNPTEIALSEAAKQYGSSLKNHIEVLDENPFDSTRKRMSVVVKVDGKNELYCKGAPDILLERCSFIQTEKGKMPLTNSDKQIIRLAMEQMAGQALRVIAIAQGNPDKGEKELCLMGLAGLMDPPRAEVAPAVELCRQAGIKPVMITGDHKDTATAIAAQVGIWNTGDKVLTGAELDKISQQDLIACCNQVSVYARVTPAHKLRIVKAYQASGKITAMTGDGVNDAPALRQADIGVAMGKNGTDVTRQASGVVLLDDNFATIVSAVEEGRVIYQNIKRFIRYLLTSNLGEVTGMLFVILAGLPVSLLPIQILLVNLFTDGLPAVALGLEPPAKGLMKQKPRPKEESLFAHGLTKTIICRGILLGALSSAVYAASLWSGAELSQARSACFLTIVFSQMLHIFECRGKGFHLGGNPMLTLATLTSMLAAAASVYLPSLQTICGTAAVTGTTLLFVVAGVLASPILATIWRWIFPKKQSKSS